MQVADYVKDVFPHVWSIAKLHPFRQPERHAAAELCYWASPQNLANFINPLESVSVDDSVAANSRELFLDLVTYSSEKFGDKSRLAEDVIAAYQLILQAPTNNVRFLKTSKHPSELLAILESSRIMFGDVCQQAAENASSAGAVIDPSRFAELSKSVLEHCGKLQEAIGEAQTYIADYRKVKDDRARLDAAVWGIRLALVALLLQVLNDYFPAWHLAVWTETQTFFFEFVDLLSLKSCARRYGPGAS